MIRDIAYTQMAGLPVAGWFGVVTMALFLTAATIMGLDKFTKIRVISRKWHPRFAVAALLVALIHMVLALSAYLSY
jgi:hypothetical protein